MFPVVLKQMQRTRMADNSARGGWRRVVVEKPFGHDLQSGKALNRLVDEVFTPQDVFRIDHYLGKETVQNLLALRFANTLFEPVWNGNFVDSVQITMAEDVGIGGRAGFYDTAGAARDVLQNHVLQLLALTAMEEPVAFDAEAIRTEKTKVLGAIAAARRTSSTTRSVASTTRAGSAASGSSATSTRRTCRRPRRPRPTRRSGSTSRPVGGPACRSTCAPASGCRAGSPRSRSSSRRRRTCPSRRPTPRSSGNNQLVVRVQPDEGITMRFGSKVPGSSMEVRDVSMDFLYGEAFTESSPGGLRAAAARRTDRRRDAVPAQRGGRAVLERHRPARGVLGRDQARALPRRRVGAEVRRRDARA